MANVITTLLKLDGTQFKSGMASARQSIADTDGVVNKAKAGWTSMFAGFASSPVVIGAAAAAVGTFAAASVSAASDLDESINAVNVTFGESADKILAFGENAAKSVGLANSEFNQLATPLGSILKNSGFALDEVADKTITLTQRAADMASVFNTDVSDALGAIQAGLRGEQDPLEQYGVSLSAAKVEARALADTGKETAKQLTDQEKALARVNIILDQTNQTAGDFQETSGGLANQSRVLAAEFENLKAKAGTVLIPALSDLAAELQLIIDGAELAGTALGGIPGLGNDSGFKFNPFQSPLGLLRDTVENYGKAWEDAGDSQEEAGGGMAVVAGHARDVADAATEAADGIGGMADTANELGPRWSAASIPLEGATGAFAEMGVAAVDAADDVAQLTEAFGPMVDKVDFLAEALQGVSDNLDMADLLDDITDQFGDVAEAQGKMAEDGQEGVRNYNREVRDLQRQLITLVNDIDSIPAAKKVEFLSEIEQGGIDNLYRILGDLTKGIVIPVSFEPKQPGFSSANFNFNPAAGSIAPVIKPAPQTALSPGSIDQRTIINNFPVGTTPTTQYIDQTIDYRRNGSR